MDISVPFAFTNSHRNCAAFVLRKIVDYYGERLVSLAVFGSYARGEPRLNSDLDVFIILKSDGWARRSERTEEFVANIEQPCDDCLQQLYDEGISMELSPIILTESEAHGFLPIYLDMTTHCLILADRDGFLVKVLERVRRQMALWGSERVNAGGHWLWEIRPGLKWNEVLHYDE